MIYKKICFLLPVIYAYDIALEKQIGSVFWHLIGSSAHYKPAVSSCVSVMCLRTDDDAILKPLLIFSSFFALIKPFFWRCSSLHNRVRVTIVWPVLIFFFLNWCNLYYTLKYLSKSTRSSYFSLPYIPPIFFFPYVCELFSAVTPQCILYCVRDFL